MPIEGIFKDRVPEAAARQIATVLVTATEHHLDHLATLTRRASSSKSDIQRQRAICDELIAQCIDLGVFPSGLRGKWCPRLAEAMGVDRDAMVAVLVDPKS